MTTVAEFSVARHKIKSKFRFSVSRNDLNGVRTIFLFCQTQKDALKEMDRLTLENKGEYFTIHRRETWGAMQWIVDSAPWHNGRLFKR